LGVLKRTPKIFVWAYTWKLSNDMRCRALYNSKTAHASKNACGVYTALLTWIKNI